MTALNLHALALVLFTVFVAFVDGQAVTADYNLQTAFPQYASSITSFNTYYICFIQTASPAYAAAAQLNYSIVTQATVTVSGSAVVPASATPTGVAAYIALTARGTRTQYFADGTPSVVSAITGLTPPGYDGENQFVYNAAPAIDARGVSFFVSPNIYYGDSFGHYYNGGYAYYDHVVLQSSSNTYSTSQYYIEYRSDSGVGPGSSLVLATSPVPCNPPTLINTQPPTSQWAFCYVLAGFDPANPTTNIGHYGPWLTYATGIVTIANGSAGLTESTCGQSGTIAHLIYGFTGLHYTIRPAQPGITSVAALFLAQSASAQDTYDDRLWYETSPYFDYNYGTVIGFNTSVMMPDGQLQRSTLLYPPTCTMPVTEWHMDDAYDSVIYDVMMAQPYTSGGAVPNCNIPLTQQATAAASWQTNKFSVCFIQLAGASKAAFGSWTSVVQMTVTTSAIATSGYYYALSASGTLNYTYGNGAVATRIITSLAPESDEQTTTNSHNLVYTTAPFLNGFTVLIDPLVVPPNKNITFANTQSYLQITSNTFGFYDAAGGEVAASNLTSYLSVVPYTSTSSSGCNVSLVGLSATTIPPASITWNFCFQAFSDPNSATQTTGVWAVATGGTLTTTQTAAAGYYKIIGVNGTRTFTFLGSAPEVRSFSALGPSSTSNLYVDSPYLDSAGFQVQLTGLTTGTGTGSTGLVQSNVFTMLYHTGYREYAGTAYTIPLLGTFNYSQSPISCTAAPTPVYSLLPNVQYWAFCMTKTAPTFAVTYTGVLTTAGPPVAETVNNGDYSGAAFGDYDYQVGFVTVGINGTRTFYDKTNTLTTIYPNTTNPQIAHIIYATTEGVLGGNDNLLFPYDEPHMNYNGLVARSNPNEFGMTFGENLSQAPSHIINFWFDTTESYDEEGYGSTHESVNQISQYSAFTVLPLTNTPLPCNVPYHNVWSFCWLFYSNAATNNQYGGAAAWSITASGIITTSEVTSNGQYSVLTMNGTRTFSQVGVAPNTVSIQRVLSATGTDDLLYIASPFLDAQGIGFETAAPASLPGTTTVSSSFAIAYNGGYQETASGVSAPERAMLSTFSYSAYDGTTPTCSASPVTAASSYPATQQFSMCFALSHPNYSVVITGTLTTAGSTITSSSNNALLLNQQAYTVVSATGTRTYSTSSGSSMSTINYLAAPGAFGFNDNLIFGTYPQLDRGGLTFVMSSPPLLNGASTTLNSSQNLLNIYWSAAARTGSGVNGVGATFGELVGPMRTAETPAVDSVFTLTPSSQPTPACVAPPANIFNFCYLLYGNPLSVSTPWTVAASGIMVISTPDATTGISTITSLNGTRTYRSLVYRESIGISFIQPAHSLGASTDNLLTSIPPYLIGGFSYTTASVATLPGFQQTIASLGFNYTYGYTENIFNLVGFGNGTVEHPFYSTFSYTPYSTSPPSCSAAPLVTVNSLPNLQFFQACIASSDPTFTVVTNLLITTAGAAVQTYNADGTFRNAYILVRAIGTRIYTNVATGVSTISTLSYVLTPGVMNNDNQIYTTDPKVNMNGIAFNVTTASVIVSGRSSDAPSSQLHIFSNANGAIVEEGIIGHTSTPAQLTTFQLTVQNVAAGYATCAPPVLTQWNYCFVMAGNPKYPLAAAGSPWSVAVSGLLATTSVVASSLGPYYPIVSIAGTRTVIIGTTSNTATISSLIAGLPGGASGDNNLLSLSPYVSTKGITYSTATASPEPGAGMSTSFLLNYNGAFAEQTTGGTIESPLLSYFEYSNTSTFQCSVPAASSVTVFPNLQYYAMCLTLSHPTYSVVTSGILATAGPSFISNSNNGLSAYVQTGYHAVFANGTRTINIYGQVYTSNIVSIDSPLSLGGNDNLVFPGVYPQMNFNGITFTMDSQTYIAGRSPSGTTNVKLNMWWQPADTNGPAAFIEEVAGGQHETTALNSSFTLTPYVPGNSYPCVATTVNTTGNTTTSGSTGSSGSGSGSGSSSGSGSGSSGVTIPLGCTKPSSVPDGSEVITVTLNEDISVLAVASTQFFPQFAAAAAKTANISTANIECGGIVGANGVTGTAEAVSPGQTQVSFYILNSNGVNVQTASASFNDLTALNANLAAQPLLSGVQTTGSAQMQSICGNQPCSSSSTDNGSSGLSETNKIITGVLVGVGGAIILCLLIACCCFYRPQSDENKPHRMERQTATADEISQSGVEMQQTQV